MRIANPICSWHATSGKPYWKPCTRIKSCTYSETFSMSWANKKVASCAVLDETYRKRNPRDKPMMETSWISCHAVRSQLGRSTVTKAFDCPTKITRVNAQIYKLLIRVCLVSVRRKFQLSGAAHVLDLFVRRWPDDFSESSRYRHEKEIQSWDNNE